MSVRVFRDILIEGIGSLSPLSCRDAHRRKAGIVCDRAIVTFGCKFSGSQAPDLTDGP
jgi:hypothetical protein